MSTIGMGALVILAMAAAPAGEEGISGRAAFQKLKALEGSWEASLMTPDGAKSSVEYRVTSGGNAVMEFQFPGTDHEMVSIYHLDGDDLVATHYCAMGNQPEMKLDARSSSEEELRFVFSGGTNFDPAKDSHIHGGRIRFDGDRVESEWYVYTGGMKEDATRFFLRRTSH